MNENLTEWEKFIKGSPQTLTKQPVRGFEVVSTYEDKGINLPVRGTKYSAGYDFEAAEDVVIPALMFKYWAANEILDDVAMTYQKLSDDEANSQFVIDKYHELLESSYKVAHSKPTMIPTGIKSYMQDGEYLQIHARSSLCKQGLILANGAAVVDSDYYNNSNNQGEIFIPLFNIGLKDVHIKKGERIAQGIFHRYLIADQDTVLNNERVGGFGSTNG